MACSKFTSRKKAMDADFAAASARAFELGPRKHGGNGRKGGKGGDFLRNLFSSKRDAK